VNALLSLPANPPAAMSACLFRRNLFVMLLLPAAAGLARGAEPGHEKGAVVEGAVIYHADAERPWRYGRYYIADRKTGRLAEAVVALRPVEKKRFPPPNDAKPAVMDQKDFRFVPETLAVRSGQPVKFLNSDPHVHNVRTTDDVVPLNVNMPSGTDHMHTFLRAGGVKRPMRITCTFHSTMKAWVFVFDYPLFQVTKADGAFKLENVPPGEYHLEMVHPAGGLAWSKPITIEAGQTRHIDIEVSPDNLTEKQP
jgi:plastocyanin